MTTSSSAGAAGFATKHTSFDRLRRNRFYIATAIMLFLMAVAARGFQAWRADETINFIVSDGRGHYVYLPSIVLDGDVDFLNQLLATFGRELERLDYDVNERTKRGLVQNKYPAGMAMTLAPPFLVGHAVAVAGHKITGHRWFRPDGYSPPYQLLCLIFIIALSYSTMRMIDQLIEGHFDVSGGAIAAGVLAFWTGSHYAWYCFREPFMIHVVSCFWATAVVCLCAKMRRNAFDRKISLLDMLMLSWSMAMAVVCRPTNLFIAPIVLWLLAGVWQAQMTWRFLRAIPAAIPGVLPLLAQAAVWHALWGHWFYYGYAEERFLWAHPQLLNTLFSVQHKGLFTWTPLLLLAMAGVCRHLFRGDARNKPLISCWLVGAAMLWYMNSAWWCWSFGWAFGARAFLELSGLFVVGLALFFEWASHERAALRRVAVGVVLLCFIYNYCLMGLYQTNRIARMDLLAGGWAPEGAPKKVLIRAAQERLQRTQSAH